MVYFWTCEIFWYHIVDVVVGMVDVSAEAVVQYDFLVAVEMRRD